MRTPSAAPRSSTHCCSWSAPCSRRLVSDCPFTSTKSGPDTGEGSAKRTARSGPDPGLGDSSTKPPDSRNSFSTRFSSRRPRTPAGCASSADNELSSQAASSGIAVTRWPGSASRLVAGADCSTALRCSEIAATSFIWARRYWIPSRPGGGRRSSGMITKSRFPSPIATPISRRNAGGSGSESGSTTTIRSQADISSRNQAVHSAPGEVEPASATSMPREPSASFSPPRGVFVGAETKLFTA